MYRIIITTLTIVAMIWASYSMLTNESSEGKTPSLPESRMSVEIKADVLKDALNKCKTWCYYTERAREFSISSVDAATFNAIVNYEGNAEAISQEFPYNYTWEADKEGTQTFTMRHIRHTGNNDIVIVPTWLLYALLENNIITQED